MPYGFNDDKSKVSFESYLKPCAYDVIEMSSRGGRDLTQVFADEIANYSDEWAWISNRIHYSRYDGIYIGDFIPLEFERTSYPAGTVHHNMRIAKIEGDYMSVRLPYKDVNIARNTSHVFFVSDAVVYLQSTGGATNNNGTADNPCPYCASKMNKFLNETMFDQLPAKVRSVIDTRYLYSAPIRYASGQVLTDDELWSWDGMSSPVELGKLWVPFEVEVFGTGVLGNGTYGCAGLQQFPLFKEEANRMLCYEGYGDESFYNYEWWTASAVAGSSTEWVKVSKRGCPMRGELQQGYAPLCFMLNSYTF